MSVVRSWAALRLAGYSFLILFLELALIRYLPGYVRIFGFYLNFVLIATFLGMGVGLLRSGAAQGLRWLAPPAFLLLFGAVKYFSNVVIEAPVDPGEYLWGIFSTSAPTVQRLGILPVVTVLFALCATFFVPLGALLGREFKKFPPLHGYAIDLSGSLLGVLAFGAASALRTPPVVWFSVAVGVWVMLSFGSWRFLGGLALAGGIAVVVASLTGGGPGREYWSPYYRINMTRMQVRQSDPTLPPIEWYGLDVNGSFHQNMLNLDKDAVRSVPVLAAVRDDYLKPFKLVPRVDTVLVLGSGTGNDVALLLELGARYIDAVEIDPTILALGSAGHSQKPYADPRVHAHVNDARAFLTSSHQRYDVVLLGTLDSQTMLSGIGSLRLDNYVYTLEAFHAIRAHLKPGASLIAYHMSPTVQIAAKLFHLIKDTFGREPLVYYQSPHRLFNYTFVIGPGATPVPEANAGVPDVVVPSDDWPYLYLLKPDIPMHYLSALGAVLAVALVMVGWAGGRDLRGGFDATMFFLGAGFLLVETKSVTEMSLLFGSTWTVSLMVFSSILVVTLIGNLLVLWRPPRSTTIPFLALFVALGIAYAVPVRELLPLGKAGEWIGGGLLVGLPVFFAALIFATSFRSRESSTRALACNLLGAIVGGVLEYSSMMFGIKSLYLIAAVAYAGALWFSRSGVLARSPVKTPGLGNTVA